MSTTGNAQCKPDSAAAAEWLAAGKKLNVRAAGERPRMLFVDRAISAWGHFRGWRRRATPSARNDKRSGFWGRRRAGRAFLSRAKSRVRDYRAQRRLTIENLETRQMLTVVVPSITTSADRVTADASTSVEFSATMPGNATGNVTFEDNGSAFASDVTLTADSGSALAFDGSTAYVDFGNHPWQNLGDQASVSAWVKIDGEGEGNGITFIKQNASGTTGASYGLVYLVGSGKISFSLATTVEPWTDYPSTTTLTTGVWYHVVGVYDGSNVKVYLNGSLDATYSVTGSLLDATGPLQIGMQNSWSPEYLYGAVDEVGIWNTALTSADVTQLYGDYDGSYGNFPQAANLVAGYHFDEGAGTTVYDFAHPDDPEHDGTIIGDADWLGSGAVGHMVATADPASSLSLGIHLITAEYGGDGSYAASSSTIAETILSPATTTLSSPETPIGQGVAVTLTATVSVSGTPTGFVEFFAGATELGSAPLSGDTAALTTTAIPVGADQEITATYEGDANFAASTTTTAAEVTVLPVVAPVLSVSTATTLPGQDVTLTATVPGNATGTVQFLDNGDDISGPQELVSGAAAALQFSNESDTSYLTASDSLNSLTDGSNTQLTLTAWIYPAANMNNDGILFKGPLDGDQGTISVSFAHGVGSPNELNFRLNGAVGTSGEVVSSTYIPNNQWTFIACTYDGANEDIYINGVLDASAAYSAVLESDTNALAVGAYYAATDSYDGHYLTFDGKIQEVGAWKQALDAATLRALFNNGAGERGNIAAAPWNENLVAGYHFGEGEGSTTVANFAPSGTSITLPTDGPSWSGGKALDNVVAVATNWMVAGAHSITAYYGGDTNYAPGTSAALAVLALPTTLPGDGAIVNDVPNQSATPSPTVDGSLVLPFDPAGLNYVSGSDGLLIVSVDAPIPSGGSGTLNGVTATLYLGDSDTGTAVGETYYAGSDVTGAADGTYRFAVKYTGTALDTGCYQFTIAIAPSYSESSPSPATHTVYQNVLNRNKSPYNTDIDPFGPGWWLDGLDYLEFNSSPAGICLVQSDGTIGFFSSTDEGADLSWRGRAVRLHDNYASNAG